MDDIKQLRTKLKIDLRIHDSKKCEYCDCDPNCCEWCGKLKNNNKRKRDSIQTIARKKRKNTI